MTRIHLTLCATGAATLVWILACAEKADVDSIRTALESVENLRVLWVEPQRDEFLRSRLVDAKIEVHQHTVTLLALDDRSLSPQPPRLVVFAIDDLRPTCRLQGGSRDGGFDLLSDPRTQDLGIRNLRDLAQRLPEVHARIASFPRHEAAALAYDTRRCWVEDASDRS